MFATKLRISQKMDAAYYGRFKRTKLPKHDEKKTEVKDLIQDNYTRYLTRAIISFICN